MATQTTSAPHADINAAMRDLPSLINMMEGIEWTRTGAQRRQTHLSKQVICQQCKRDGWPPERCIWVPTKSRKACPRCQSKDAIDAGRVDPFIDHYLPHIQELENLLRERAVEFVRAHGVWHDWAQNVKGLGEISLAKVMGHCDINRLTTITQMWAHAGHGLMRKVECNDCGREWHRNGQVDACPHTDKDGNECGSADYEELAMVPQRKVRGQIIDYDAKLQSHAFVAGECLMRGKGKYHAYYRERRQSHEAQGCSEGHAHNRAFRDLRKLFLSHLWTVWRHAEGLQARPPYAIDYLDHDGYIAPHDMVE